jgi:hypothetical protein
MTTLLTIYLTGAIVTGTCSHLMDDFETPTMHAVRGLLWFILLPLSLLKTWEMRSEARP